MTLEERVKRLEDQIKLIIYDPSQQTFPTNFPLTNPRLSNKCSLCGLDFSGAMGYVCPNSGCPVQSKAI